MIPALILALMDYILDNVNSGATNCSRIRISLSPPTATLLTIAPRSCHTVSHRLRVAARAKLSHKEPNQFRVERQVDQQQPQFLLNVAFIRNIDPKYREKNRQKSKILSIK